VIRNKLYFLLISVLTLSFSSLGNAHSVQPIDCIGVQSGSIQEGYFSSYDYVLQINSLCTLNSISDIDRLRGTGITLEIRGPQTIRKTSSVGNLSSSQKISLSLGSLKDGNYTVTLQLFKPGEGSRTLKLPNFNISNILECIELSRSFTEEISNKTTLKVYLRNSCAAYSDTDFSTFDIKMEFVRDFNSLARSEILPISRLSSSETLFVFNLDSVPPGIYIASSIKVYTSNKSRELVLDIFAISKKNSNSVSPSPTPTRAPSSQDPLNDFQQCVSSKGFDESCTYAPDWYFEFCTVLTNGTLEQKIGNNWKFVKKVKTSGVDKSCGKNLNLFEIEGVNNSTTKKLTFRVKLSATPKYAQTSIVFYITPRYRP
jgi:hypothetical protein